MHAKLSEVGQVDSEVAGNWLKAFARAINDFFNPAKEAEAKVNNELAELQNRQLDNIKAAWDKIDFSGLKIHYVYKERDAESIQPGPVDSIRDLPQKCSPALIVFELNFNGRPRSSQSCEQSVKLSLYPDFVERSDEGGENYTPALQFRKRLPIQDLSSINFGQGASSDLFTNADPRFGIDISKAHAAKVTAVRKRINNTINPMLNEPEKVQRFVSIAT